MKDFAAIAAFGAMLAFAGSAAAVDCNRYADHMPGYCGVLSNDTQCASPANRVRGRCNIPSASFYVNNSGALVDNINQVTLAPAGSFDLRDDKGSVVALVAAGGGNLVAAGGGNLVAAGGGNFRTLSAGGKRVFVVRK